MRRAVNRAVLYCVLCLFVVVFLFPILYMFYISGADPMTLGKTGFNLVLDKFTFHNYWVALFNLEFDFYRAARNSFIITLIPCVIQPIASALVAYGFSRFRAKGKEFFFMIILGTMMIPPLIGFIPTYLIFKGIGILGTFWPWVLWSIGGSAFFIFLFRQFFNAIPIEYDDAAKMDGCSPLKTFAYIIIPMSMPVYITSIILLFNWNWGDYLGPLIFLSKAELLPLSVMLQATGMQNYIIPKGFGNSLNYNNDPLTIAVSLIYMVPVILVFIFAQKYIVRGIITTGIKG